MNSLPRRLLNVASSRAVLPVVVGIFLLLYVAVAFFTDEALLALMALTRRNTLLALLLALIPLSGLLRMLRESLRQLQLRRALAGGAEGGGELWDEELRLPQGSPDPAELERRLASSGYRTRRTEGSLAAWRGISLFPVRLIFLAWICCLYAGILISVTTRSSQRGMVVEGATLSTPRGAGGIVERVRLADSTGPVLAKTLTIEVAPPAAGGAARSFGLYPPALYQGFFVYPRYLGLALHLRLLAPDLAGGFDTTCPLNSYPPGKEDRIAVPGSPYALVLSIAEPPAGSERYISYITGNVPLQCKLLKGSEVVLAGNIPARGELTGGGYRVAVPETRRLVVTDFIGDYGVPLIWAAGLLFLAAPLLWLPVRFLFPRREICLRFDAGGTRAFSRAEGGAGRHAGVFHEALDFIAGGEQGRG